MSLLPTIGAVDQDTGFYNGVATTSLRLAGATTLTNTYGTPTSSKKMSFGGWVKRATITKYCQIWGATTGGSVDQAYIVFNASDQLFVQISQHGVGNQFLITTDRVFRDTSAWYHLWVEIDSTDGTDADRVKVYINGVRETKAPTTTIADGSPDVIAFNVSGVSHVFGHPSATYGGDLYYSDWYFIDGLDVSPIDTVGEFKNGVFIPKSYTPSSFGTNGWHLKFDQVGVGTPSTSTIGADSSGKDTPRHWTSTADTNVVASDCALPDSPENNFSVWNALFKGGEGNSSIATDPSLSAGNLQVSLAGNSYIGNTFRPISGKWYCEIRVKTIGSTNGEIDWGWLQATTYAGTTGHSGQANKWGAYYHAYSTDHIQVYDETSQLGSNINLTISAGDVLQLAWDIDNNKGWVGINDTYYAADNGTDGNPSAGTNQTFTFTDDEAQNLQCYIANGTGTDVHVANFGQDSTFGGDETATTNADANGIGAFHHAPPTGFLALCSANISDDDIPISPAKTTQAVDHFGVLTYTGGGSASRSIVSGGTDIGGEIDFKPDWLWVKSRSATYYNGTWDSSRTNKSALYTNEVDDEDTSTAGTIGSLDTNGFTTPNVSSGGFINIGSATYVAWNWKANGGTTATNDASATSIGSQDSVYQANTTSGFSIVLYTGTGANATFAHGVQVNGVATAPRMIIMKRRDSNQNWVVYHEDNGNDRQLLLNSNNAQTGSNSVYFQNTSPTTTVFSLGSDDYANASGGTYVAYCFADVEGYSKIGKYNPNNSTDSAFVYTGFKPAMVILKGAEIGSQEWCILDNQRPGYNSVYNLNPDSNAAETTGNTTDFLSNGFKIRATGGVGYLTTPYIYIAFAEAPFKYANAG